MVNAEEALPGRRSQMPVPALHEVLRHAAAAALPGGHADRGVRARLLLGRGAEVLADRRASYSTAVGYEGGFTPNPTYEEVCTGRTGHAEAVRVVFDPAKVSYEQLLKVFWESHDPTQGMRQGNDVGTQYRSAIFYHRRRSRRPPRVARPTPEAAAPRPATATITTEIVPAGEFYFAEDYHQQYLYKVPHGYCPDHSTGVSCPVGMIKAD